jgi:hypothetical protein
MKEDSNIKYEFETNNRFLAYLFPAIFLPIYYDAEMNIVFKVLIYIIPAWLLNTFDYNKMIIYNDNIFYTKYTRPFTKTYNIPFSDIEKVYVTRMEMSIHNTPTLIITSKSLKKKLKVQIYRGIDESLCEYFIDNNIKVESNSSSLRNHISHYMLGHKTKNK